MAWSATSRVELANTDKLEDRIRDLQLALIVGRARPQYAGERTEDVKWRIAEATFHERLPWEIEWESDHD